jgi:uncharacterized 2Fe-2S/4Fe-4S cluster protein (DUF4445 family)
MATVSVRFEPAGTSVEVPSGTTVRDAADLAGAPIPSPCGGLGRCGGCRVRASGGLDEPGRTELDALGAAARHGVRLACLARLTGPGEAVIDVPPAPGALKIVTEGPELRFAADASAIAAGRCEGAVRAFGAAVDIGTTTVAGRLHDLGTGAVLGEAAALNPQAVFGDDVLSRVSRAMAGEAPTLRRLVTRQVEDLVSSMVDRPSLADGTLCDVVIVGNPTMTHLFLGRDVAPLAGEPYADVLTDEVDIDAADADMPDLGQTGVHVGPGVSAFVGADAVAATLATDLVGRLEPTLLVDLGTNGEVVLSARGRLFAASTAAGPAFEGAGISKGMRAELGAVDRVWVSEHGFEIATVGDEHAVGICGSGLLDLVSVLLDAGVLDPSGRMHARGPLGSRVVHAEEGLRFTVAPGVELTQFDVRQLQLAKAAVRVAVDVLVAEAGLDDDDVAEVIVAGGFGSNLRPGALSALGVLPAAWAERIVLGGNAALAGASAMLVSRAARAEADRIADIVVPVPLAGRDDFQSRFMVALDFPAG